MKIYLWLSLIVTGIVMISVAVFSNVPGHVELAWRGVEYQVTLLSALLLLFAIIACSYLLLRALIGLLSLPLTLSSLWQSLRRIRPIKHADIGLAAFLSEDWRLAHRSLEDGAASQGSQAACFMLLAARAAMEQGEPVLTKKYLRQAEGMAQDDAARQALAYLSAISDDKNATSTPAQCAEQLAGFLKKYPQHEVARSRLALLYQELGEMEKLDTLFGKEAISEQQSDVVWQKKIWLRRLDAAVTGDADTRLRDLQRTWRKLPRTIIDSIECISHYLELMGLRTGQEGADMAVQEIEQHVQKVWQSQLVALYGLISGENVAAQIKVASAWQIAHPDDADLALCLGYLYLRQGALAQAAEQLERAVKARPEDASILSELARVAAAQGEFAKSHGQLVAAKSHTA